MNKLQLNKIYQRKIVFLFFLMVALGQTMVSCYRKSTQNKNHFKASIDLISYNDKIIQIFYKLKTDDRYYEELSIKKNVKGSTALQNVVFELPGGIKPKNIRIDLGDNEKDSIRVENICFQYKNRAINGDKGAYKSWFALNDLIAEGKDGLTFRLKKTDNYFDPHLDGNQILNSKLVKLFPPDINEF